LFLSYVEFKSKTLKNSSFKDLKRTLKHMADFPTSEVTPAAAKEIRAHLLTSLSQETARRVLQQVSACCRWASEMGMIELNPFEGLPTIKRKKQGSEIYPFTRDERDRIIDRFSTDPTHQAFAPYVRFLFLTGCRPSEAIGLQWRHVNCEFVTFAEPVVEGFRESSTKNASIRRFPINKSLAELLESIKPVNSSQNSPVFVSTGGGMIRQENFNRRHWRPVLDALEIPYRRPYNTRHTFATLCLDAGVPVQQVASWLGHSPTMTLTHYAGLTRSEVPEL
jgi:integrase